MDQFDKAIELQLDIARVSASVQADVIKQLRKLERELIAEVATENYSEWRKARVEKQLAIVSVTIADYYQNVADTTSNVSQSIALISAKSTKIGMGTAAVLPSAESLEVIVSDSIVLGAPQSAWWAKQSGETSFNFNAAVRRGLVASETNQQIIQRVKGVMSIASSNAAALVQTSVASVANDARMAVFAENEDIIKRYRAVATLDTNTCLVCAPLDGLEWDSDGEPIDHEEPFPEYPLHYNCRCLLLGRITDEAPSGKRASSDGEVNAKTTFSGWLARQSEEKQQSVLGVGRAKLFADKKITLNDLVNGNGNPLSLTALEDKYG